MYDCTKELEKSFFSFGFQNGDLPKLWMVGVAWCLRELWTYPLFVGGVWSREIVWKGTRFRVKFGGKTVKLD